MNLTRRHALAATAAAIAAPAAFAQANWPSKQIRIVVPYPPGGSSDIIARAISNQLAEKDMKRAEAMERERLAQEKDAPKALVIGPKEAPAPVAAKEHKKAREPEVFTAAGPKKAKK